MLRFTVVLALATLVHFGIVGGWVAIVCGTVAVSIVVAALFADNPLGRIAFRVRRGGGFKPPNFAQLDLFSRGDGGIARRRRD
jgi:hypothetical protein